MIYIIKNSTNNVVLDLTSRSLLWNNSGITPSFLFSFINQGTGKSVVFTGPNLSNASAATSYDQFSIIETGNTYVNLTACTVNLSPGQFWNYSVYEQQPSLSASTDLTQVVGQIASGRVWVSGTSLNSLYTTYSGSTPGYFTFN